MAENISIDTVTKTTETVEKPTNIGVPPKSTKEETKKEGCEGGNCGCKGCRRHKRGKLLLTVGIVAGLFLLLKD
jgi:hypothetical protein